MEFSIPYSIPSYVFSPKWFYGFDSIIEIIAIIISLLLVYYSYKCYKLTGEKRFLYFSIAFISLTLAFFTKIIGTLAIYSRDVRESALAKTMDSAFESITIFSINSAAFLLHTFFMIFGIMMLFLIISKLTWENKRVIAMLLYFVIIATWLGAIHYQLFYATTFVMLTLISLSYYQNYKEIKSENAKLVAYAFLILLISNAFFIFIIYSKTIYVIAELLQLLGFIYLLIPFILVLKKKPKKHGIIK